LKVKEVNDSSGHRTESNLKKYERNDVLEELEEESDMSTHRKKTEEPPAPPAPSKELI